MLRSLKSTSLVELVRFVIAGLIVTLFSASIYLAIASALGVHPLLANCAAYLAGVLLGYRLHFHWTFRTRTMMRSGAHGSGRFLIGSLSGLLLNTLWTWLFTNFLDGPTWLPILPMTMVTPWVSFKLNQRWVFGRATLVAAAA